MKSWRCEDGSEAVETHLATGEMEELWGQVDKEESAVWFQLQLYMRGEEKLRMAPRFLACLMNWIQSDLSWRDRKRRQENIVTETKEGENFRMEK